MASNTELLKQLYNRFNARDMKTPTRRDFSIVALTGLAAFAAGATSASATEQISPEQALKALDPW
jgi:hypothetical protein